MDKPFRNALISIFIIILITLFFGVSYSKSLFLFKNDSYKFGASFMTMNNSFYKVIESEIKNIVELHNDELITLDPALNPDKQDEQINYLIDQNVDVIFVTPIDYNKIMPSLKKAKEAGICVIVVDAPVNNSEYIDMTIVSDNYQAGVLCAEDLMSKTESANIFLLEHSTAMSGISRINGFKDTIAKNNNFKIVYSAECYGQIEYSYPITSEALELHPEINAIFALNDPSAIGALAAIEKHGLNNCFVYGVDGTPSCKALIKNEKGMTATIAQFPIKIGNQAITSAYKMLEGLEVPSELIYPVQLIDESNISNFDIGGWQ